jgi:hypothetical protein
MAKSIEDQVIRVFASLGLGEIEEFTQIDEETIKVMAEGNDYIIKKYDKKNNTEKHDSKLIINQLNLLEELGKKGVPVFLPLEFSKKYMIYFKGSYYVIYHNEQYQTLSNEEIDIKKIKKAANTLAIINNLKLNGNLPKLYDQIDINFNKVLRKAQKMSKGLYKIIYENLYYLEDIQERNNQALKYLNNNYIVSYFDYNADTILWKNNYMYLSNYENLYKLNPSVTLAESAYLFSLDKYEIDDTKYLEFLKAYIKKSKDKVTDFKEILPLGVNILLQELELMLNGISSNEELDVEYLVDTINIVAIYDKYLNVLYNLYLEAVKKQ